MTLAAWIAATFGALALWHLLMPATPGADLACLLAGGAALIASIAAARSLPTSAGPWSLVAVGALSSATGSLLHLATPETAGTLFPSSTLTLVPFAAGVAWMVHNRDRYRRVEIAIDLALITGGIFLGLMRWAPGVREVVFSDTSPTVFLDATLGPVAAFASIAFSVVLIASLRGSQAGDSAASMFGAAVLFAVAEVPDALGTSLGPATGLAVVAAWGFVAYAGIRVVRGGAEFYLPADTDSGSARLRQAIAPLATLLLAVLVTDVGIRSPLTPTGALVGGLLAATVALRVSRLLEATKDRHSEQRQLEQSQALVEVSRALAGATALDDTLSSVTDWAGRLLDARAAVIELLTEDGEELVVRAAVGFPEEFVGLRFAIEGSFTGWVVRTGMVRTTVDASSEPDIMPRSRRFLPHCAVVSAPLRFHDRILGVLSALADEPFDRHDLALLGALADQAAVAIENARLFEEVNRLSLTDPLTGLANRRRLEEELQREFSAAIRGRRLIAVMFDLNEFKEYNDRYGHLAGDEALRLFGDALGGETRAMNLGARFGGDEFVALLGDSTLQGARVFAQRVKRRYARSVAALGRRPIGVAVGIAPFAPGMRTPSDLLAAADAALYEMKSRRVRTG